MKTLRIRRALVALALVAAIGCASRSGGGQLSPEGAIALRGTAVVNAINGAAPQIEALTQPNSCGVRACMSAAEGQAVAERIRQALGYANQLPPILTAVDKATDAGAREAGMKKAGAIVRSIQESISQATVPPDFQEGRAKVVIVLQAVEFALIALGGF